MLRPMARWHLQRSPFPRLRGVKLGGRNAQSDKTKAEALARAEQLRPVLAELAHMSARAAADELNRRKIETPAGGRWHGLTVQRARERLQRGGQLPRSWKSASGPMLFKCPATGRRCGGPPPPRHAIFSWPKPLVVGT